MRTAANPGRPGRRCAARRERRRASTADRLLRGGIDHAERDRDRVLHPRGRLTLARDARCDAELQLNEVKSGDGLDHPMLAGQARGEADEREPAERHDEGEFDRAGVSVTSVRRDPPRHLSTLASGPTNTILSRSRISATASCSGTLRPHATHAASQRARRRRARDARRERCGQGARRRRFLVRTSPPDRPR